MKTGNVTRRFLHPVRNTRFPMRRSSPEHEGHGKRIMDHRLGGSMRNTAEALIPFRYRMWRPACSLIRRCAWLKGIGERPIRPLFRYVIRQRPEKHWIHVINILTFETGRFTRSRGNSITVTTEAGEILGKRETGKSRHEKRQSKDQPTMISEQMYMARVRPSCNLDWTTLPGNNEKEHSHPSKHCHIERNKPIHYSEVH